MMSIPPNTDENPPHISMERVITALNEGEIETEIGMLRWSSNRAFLLTVQHEEVTVEGVYKPQSGERPLWDFREGTLCLREYASFLTSQALGWQLVPPTALRTLNYGLGTLQFFIAHDPNIHYFTWDEELKAELDPQLRRLCLFDLIVNNADRKGGHCLLDAENHLWGIDHGITFHAQNKLRTVIWDFVEQPLSNDEREPLEQLLQQLCDLESAYRQALDKLLHISEIEAFVVRIQRLLKSNQFPLPRGDINYPWPPV